MKKALIFINLFFVMVLSAQELSVMTYNIKLDYPKEGENSWTNRKDFFINQLKFYEPDIMGVQEAMPNQMKDIDNLLGNYSFVGVGRDDGKDAGEYSAIFYKKNQFTILKSSTFWLSQTPEKISMGWDAVCNRVCTYALFQNKSTKKIFWVFNTHFDHVGEAAKTNGLKLILSKIKELNSKKYPVVLMGDFNSEPETDRIIELKKMMDDSREISVQPPFGPSGTFNAFRHDLAVTRLIDYIFLSKGGAIKVNKYAILSDSKDLKYPSDHLPVYIEIDFK